MKQVHKLKDQDGSVLVVAMVILVLLTLLGISATRTSDIEIQISKNEKIYKENFYRAEAGSMETVQRLENENGDNIMDPSSSTLGWLNLQATLGNPDDMTDDENWTDTYSEVSVNPDDAGDQDTRFLAIAEGIMPGDSLDASGSRIFSFSALGRGSARGGASVIQMGYRRAL